MDFNLFTDAINALEKLGTSLVGLKDIPVKERQRYREVVDETLTLLDQALLLVIMRLGDVLQEEDRAAFAHQLKALDNVHEWEELERNVRLCQALRVTGRELQTVWSKLASRMSLTNTSQFDLFLGLIQRGETALADYIHQALTQLARVGDAIQTDADAENARRTARGVRNALQAERRRLIKIQTTMIEAII